MIVTCHLARDEIGDTLVDTVDVVSNSMRGSLSPRTVERWLLAQHYDGGRYETMVCIGSNEPSLYRTRTWQAALCCHRWWMRYAEQRRINVIWPATYMALSK